MKLYVGWNGLGWTGDLPLYDADGNVAYNLSNKHKGPGPRRFVITDTAGNEVAVLQQKMSALLGKYILSRPGEKDVTIKRHLGANYEIKELGWVVKGNFKGHDYVAKDKSGNVKYVVSKSSVILGASTQFSSEEGVDVMLAVATLLAVECEMLQALGMGAGSAMATH
ncbi:MAG: hypothetical protein Q4E12_08110 [Coriobacteriia bacterium]|nr:hypothetical protein [Coriobacteriia bacterium]